MDLIIRHILFTVVQPATGTGFTPIHSISSSHNSWSDPNPLPDVGYYRLAAKKPDPCYPTGGGKKADSGPYSHAMSNIDDNRLQESGENQAPDSMLLSNQTIDENQSIGSFVGRMGTNDPDTSDHHVYKLVAGTGDDDNNMFTTLGDLLITATELDYESQDTCFVRIKSIDKGDLSVEQTFIILVNDVDETIPNEAPIDISMSSNTIAENKSSGSLIGKIWTDDPDIIDDHNYSLADGPGAENNDHFMIIDDMLLSAAEFDYEDLDTLYIRIKSTDKGDISIEKSFIIRVTDVNEGPGNQAPINITIGSNTIDENGSAGILVGAFATEDPNEGDVHGYSLVDGLGASDNPGFTIMGNILVAGASFDYETKDTLFIRVASADQDGLSCENSFIILVNDLLEKALNLSPANITFGSNTIDEDSPVMTLIGRFQTDDPNFDDLHTYQLVDGEGDDENNSFILLSDALFSSVIFDYEIKDEYQIRVRSTDNGEGSLSTEKSFIVLINDLLEVDNTSPQTGSDELNIYPNPITNTAVIKFPNPEKLRYRMNITDLAGKVVYLEDNICTEQLEFKRRNLPAGVYIVEIRGRMVYRAKLVIE